MFCNKRDDNEDSLQPPSNPKHTRTYAIGVVALIVWAALLVWAITHS